MNEVEGPFFDDLEVGDVFTAPSMTLTAGRAAAHHAIIGSRLPLALDEHLARRVAGAPLADPAFVTDVAIGQSTTATRRVIANLFYRGLAFHRLPHINDTLRTRTEVVGLRQNASRPSGLAALRITTLDQDSRVVLDFWRCAMLPLSSPSVVTGHADDLSRVGVEPNLGPLIGSLSDWKLDAWVPDLLPEVAVGTVWQLQHGDVVSNAPELARLTLNVAHVHHDRFSQPSGRLVYGGHTIGIALAQVTKVLPNLVTVGGWRGCDHTGPVREGDTLMSHIEVTDVTALGGSLRAADLTVTVRARRDDVVEEVLAWRPIVLLQHP